MTGQIKEWLFKVLLVCVLQGYSCQKYGRVLVKRLNFIYSYFVQCIKLSISVEILINWFKKKNETPFNPIGVVITAPVDSGTSSSCLLLWRMLKGNSFAKRQEFSLVDFYTIFRGFSWRKIV